MYLLIHRGKDQGTENKNGVGLLDKCSVVGLPGNFFVRRRVFGGYRGVEYVLFTDSLRMYWTGRE